MAYGQQPYGQHGFGQGGYSQQPPPYGQPPQYAPPPYQQQPYQPPVQQYAPPKARRRREEVPTGGHVSDEDERWAVPAYVGMFVTGFIAPAVVYLVKGRTSRFARFHAAQALNLFIAMFACNLVAFLVTYFVGTTGLLITLLIVAGEFFCVVKAAIGANRYEWYRLPTFVAWPVIR